MISSDINKSGQVRPENHTILIVEDNPVNLKIVQRVLLNAKYQTVTAITGADAIQIAIKELPDLILLDVILPDIDGYEVCRLLKSTAATDNIPVIFMTGLTNTESVVQAFDLGAVDYVPKPFKAAEVLARINTHLTLRNLQQGLQHEIKERELLITDLEAFTHTVAHDLKNPIGRIVGFADILKQSRGRISEDEIDNMLQYLVNSAFKMRNIIDSLLLLARVRLESVETVPIDMNVVLQEVIERLQPMIAEYDAQITMPHQWPLVEGYQPWVEEVWVNYISNGLKYGGTPPHLELGATAYLRKDATAVKFWIRDNGDGLTSEQQASLFQPFTRMHKNKAMGHGLGLSIVARIVDKLGGTVGVECAEGAGSLFYFTLNLKDGIRPLH